MVPFPGMGSMRMSRLRSAGVCVSGPRFSAFRNVRSSLRSALPSFPPRATNTAARTTTTSTPTNATQILMSQYRQQVANCDRTSLLTSGFGVRVPGGVLQDPRPASLLTWGLWFLTSFLDRSDSLLWSQRCPSRARDDGSTPEGFISTPAADASVAAP